MGFIKSLIDKTMGGGKTSSKNEVEKSRERTRKINQALNAFIFESSRKVRIMRECEKQRNVAALHEAAETASNKLNALRIEQINTRRALEAKLHDAAVERKRELDMCSSPEEEDAVYQKYYGIREGLRIQLEESKEQYMLRKQEVINERSEALVRNLQLHQEAQDAIHREIIKYCGDGLEMKRQELIREYDSSTDDAW